VPPSFALLAGFAVLELSFRTLLAGGPAMAQSIMDFAVGHLVSCWLRRNLLHVV